MAAVSQVQEAAEDVFAGELSEMSAATGLSESEVLSALRRMQLLGAQPAFRAATEPCLHADPQFEDCLPGVTRHLRGWVSFYEGTDIESELTRLSADPGW